MALFFSFSGIIALNNILLLITRSRLSKAQASSSLKCFNIHTFMYATPTFITEALHLVTQVYIADCYSELMPYTVLVNSYWVIFHNACQCQGHAQ